MAFDYEDAGTFGSEREAKDWAQRNKVDLRDLHIRNVGASASKWVSARAPTTPAKTTTTSTAKGATVSGGEPIPQH